jgi:hypothetical protein
LDEDSVRLILEVQREQNLGARRPEKIIEFKHLKHIPHNAIHKMLLHHCLANANRNKSKSRKPGIGYELGVWIGIPDRILVKAARRMPIGNAPESNGDRTNGC